MPLLRLSDKQYLLCESHMKVALILSHTNPVLTTTPHFLKIYFNITNQFMPRSQKVVYFISISH